MNNFFVEVVRTQQRRIYFKPKEVGIKLRFVVFFSVNYFQYKLGKAKKKNEYNPVFTLGSYY